MNISTNKINHWAYNYALEAIDEFGNEQVVCSGWSPSGVYHIGNSREAVTCNAIHLELQENGSKSKFIFVIDDYDPLDKIPYELKKHSKDLIPYLGHPLVNIPDFTETFENYASYFANGPKQALNDWGFKVDFVKVSELYKEGKYDNFLNLYIENENKLQEIMEATTGSRMDSLVSITCQNCNNAKTTQIQGLPLDNKFAYTCKTDKQYKGCDYQGELEIVSHEWKLKWRLDWPARQQFLGVTIEPSGKDHSVAGGSVDTANQIHKSIFQKQGPMLLRYGFITLKGKKFSGSKGGALAADQIASMMPYSAFLYMVYRSDLLKDISFNPQSDEYGILLDEFDIARRMWKGEVFDGRAREVDKLSTAAYLAMTSKEKESQPAKVKFNELVLIHQSSFRKIGITIAKLQKMDKIPDQSTVSELNDRIPRIEKWIDELAPDNVKFTILSENSIDIANHWTKDIKTLWLSVLNKVNQNFTANEFTLLIRDLSMEYNLSPKEFYPPFYQMVLGKSRGPNVANLVVAIGKEELISRINSISVK